MNLYRNIILTAVKSAWHHKYLWFFGLFATLLGSTGELELIFGSTDGGYQEALAANYNFWADTGIFSLSALNNIVNLATHKPLAFFIAMSLLLSVLLLGLFLVWLTITSQAGLVFNTAKIRLEKKHSFKDGLNAGMNKFWPVLGLNFGLKFIVALFYLLLAIPVFSQAILSAWMDKVFFILFLIFIPLSIIFSFIVKYAIAFVVVRDSKFLTALRESYELFKKNWLVSIEMAFILFFLSFISWILLILFFLVLAAPIVFIIMVFSQVLAYVNYMVLVLGAIFVYIVAIIVFGSFLTTFQVSAWTNLFIDLIGRGGESKLNRLFKK